MEVPITQFRREIFALVNQALEGAEVWVTHRGQRLRIAPEGRFGTRLSRITPMEVIDSSGNGLADAALQAEMARSWEQDWERDFGPAPESHPRARRSHGKP
jgi:antitoxin (DNA-binding transcriptional repressor) of toxin-antitoxin stability system